MSLSLATVSLSINDSETMKKPTHIIMWQDESVTSLVATLTARVDALEKLLVEKEFRTPLISGIDMKRRSDSLDCLSAVLPNSNAAAVFNDLLSAPLDLKTITIAPRTDITPDMDEAEEEAEEEVEDDAEEEADIEEADAEEAEVEEEAEEAEEALQLNQFEYKGVTYYRDADLQVYQLDTDGDLDETAIGVWNEDKQKVLKYAKA